MKSRLSIFFLLLVSVVSLFTACSKEEPLRVSTHTWIGYESLPISDQQGYLPDSIRLFMTRSASESLDRLESGAVDAATLTLDEVLQGRSMGMDLTVVLVMNLSAGADVVYAREPVENFEQLKGKRVAYEAGAVGELMLQALLNEGNLALKDIEPVTFSAIHLEGVWRNNLADIVICYEPTASQIEKSGGVRIFDSRQMPNKIFDVLAVKTDVLNGKSEQIKQLIEAHFQALNYLWKNNAEAIQKIAARNGVEEEDVLKALEGVTIPGLQRNKKLLQSDGVLHQAAQSLQHLLVDREILKATSLKNIVTDDYLPERTVID